MAQLKWVFQYMKGARWKFAVGAILMLCFYTPLEFCGSLITSHVIDLIGLQANATLITRFLLLFVGVHLLRGVFSYALYCLLDDAGATVLRNFRTTLYNKLQSLSHSFYASTRTGDIMMRLTSDLEMLRHFSAFALPQALMYIIIFIGCLTLYFCTNYKLTLILLWVVPATAITINHMRKRSAVRHSLLREKGSALNACTQENIAANRVVKAFAREAFEEEKFKKCNEEYRDAAIDAALVWGNHGPILGIISGAMNISILVFGGLFVVWGEMTLGQLFLFYNLSGFITSTTTAIGTIVNDFQNFIASTQKVSQLYYARCDIRNKENAVTKMPDENSGRVVFDHVTFKYDKYTIIDDVSLTVAPGETVGIMGPTGSGKSTLMLMISRFLDAQKGSVLIDGTDVKNYDLTTLRHYVSYAMQDVFLFSNTIGANIAYGTEDLSEDAIADFAKMADADGFIRRTADGYDTIIGERGVGLSGGQKQRISLARALAYDTPILVLDDTTSALDMETEHYIQKQLAAREKKQTTFIVAQRISSVKDADKIIIMENGRITECGTHEELLKNKGYYYDVFCIQQGLANESAKEADDQ